jgi:hypothetical protein
MILFRQETAEEMPGGSAQPFEKAQFAEGTSLDFASPGLDFTSLRLGFSFLELGFSFPASRRFAQEENSAAPREPDEQ